MIQDLISGVSRRVAVEGQTMFDAVHQQVLSLSEAELELVLCSQEEVYSPVGQKIQRMLRSMVFEREHRFIERLHQGHNLQDLYLNIREKALQEHPLTPRGIYFTACFSAVQKMLVRCSTSN